MAYNVHYRIAYKRLSNSQTTIDILENSYGGSVVNLNPDATPLTITKSGDINNIFQPTIGSGAVINVMATPLTLLGLFTTDPQQFIVKCYNGSSGTGLFWQGFVNAQIYNEDYSLNIPVPISINANDGMAVLDSLYYKNADGSFYSGSTTIGTVLNSILGKLGITFSNIYTSNDLSTNGYTSNLFLNIKVNNECYITESLQAQTCREVLNSILSGIPLSMYFKSDKIFIYDPINLNNSALGKAYTLPAFSESTFAVGGYADIISGTTGGSSSIGYYQTGQGLDIVPIVNEVDIKYNSYNTPDFVYDFNTATGDSFTHFQTYVTPFLNNYYSNTTVLFKNWTQKTSGGTAASGHFVGVKEAIDGAPTFGLYLDNSGDILTYKIPLSNINTDSMVYIKFSFDAYLVTRVNDGVDNSDYGDNIFAATRVIEVNSYYVLTSLQCGNQYWKGTSWSVGQTGGWQQTIGFIQDGVTSAQYALNHRASKVNDTWANGHKLAQLDTSVTGGSLTFNIYCTYGAITPYWTDIVHHPEDIANITFRRVLIKNVKLEFVNKAGVSIGNAGVNVKGNVDTSLIYKTNPYEISTTNGSTGSFGISKGSYLTTSNQTLVNFGIYRSGTVYMTEKVVLQEFISQYKVPRRKLTANLNVKNYLLDLNMKLITDYKYQSGKAFYIVNSTYNDSEESMNCEMIEICPISSRESIT